MSGVLYTGGPGLARSKQDLGCDLDRIQDGKYRYGHHYCQPRIIRRGQTDC